MHYCKSHLIQLFTCVLPQGSTFGPLLFLVYIIDLPLVIDLQVKLFADDSNLTPSNKDAHSLQNDINNELKKMDYWMWINELSINYKKTNYLVLTRKIPNFCFKIKIENSTMNQKPHVQYFGVVIDEKLNWEEHAKNVTAKIANGS